MTTPETQRPTVHIPGMRPAFIEPYGARAPRLPPAKNKVTKNTYFCCWLFGYNYVSPVRKRRGCCWIFGYEDQDVSYSATSTV